MVGGGAGGSSRWESGRGGGVGGGVDGVGGPVLKTNDNRIAERVRVRSVNTARVVEMGKRDRRVGNDVSR